MADVILDLYEYSSDGTAQTSYLSNAATYTSQYPSPIDTTTVLATTDAGGAPPHWQAWNACNPSASLIGGSSDASWQNGNNLNVTLNRFHIDLGTAKIITRIYYENFHSTGASTERGVKAFTFWGSNTGVGTFDDLVYANDGGWTQLTCSQATFDQHIAANQADPKYITVTNTTAYRYYAFKFASAWTGYPPTGTNYWQGMRRLELQTGLNLQDYSEGTIKEEGSYALKGVALITDSLNKTLTRTIGSPLNLTDKNYILFWIRASRTGSNIKIGLHDSGGTTSENTPNIAVGDTWQEVIWDISAVSNANKDAIDQIIITVVNADADNTFYIDNMVASEYIRSYEGSDIITLTDAIELDQDWLHQDTTTITDEITVEVWNQEIEDIDNDFRSMLEFTYNISNYFNSSILYIKNISNRINTIFSYIFNITNDFRSMKECISNITNDIRTRLSWQVAGDAGVQSLGKQYISLYINDIEIIDFDVDSINIIKSPNQAHTASFNLARAYDDSKPSIDDTIKIYYDSWLLFRGYIINISPTDSPESIKIGCQDYYYYLNKSYIKFSIGHQPKEQNLEYETYYATYNNALSSGCGWSTGIGLFVPDRTSIGGRKGDIISQLIIQCGNYGWFCDVNNNFKLITQGSGNIINLTRQGIGTNLGLYQVLSHQFSESTEDLVNKYLVHTGNSVYQRYNAQTTNTINTTNKNLKTEQTSWEKRIVTVDLVPDWLDEDAQLRSLPEGRPYGYNYPDPDKSAEHRYEDVFKRYKFGDIVNNKTSFNSKSAQTGSESFTYLNGDRTFVLSRSNIQIQSVKIAGFVTYEYTYNFLSRILTVNDIFLYEGNSVIVIYKYIDAEWSDDEIPKLEILGLMETTCVPDYDSLHLDVIKQTTEGFSIDYEREIVTLSSAVYNVTKKDDGTWENISRPDTVRLILSQKIAKPKIDDFNNVPELPDPIDQPVDGWEYTNYFLTPKIGDYGTTILQQYELGGYSVQIGYSRYNSNTHQYEEIPSWNDLPYAYDLAYWNLTKIANIRKKGSITLTLDAVCYYEIDLTKRIYISGITTESLNVVNMNYNLNNFTVTLDLEKFMSYNRTRSLPYHGD